MLSLRRKDLTFIFIFICLYILCFSFLTYMGKQERFQELSNELYTNHNAVFIYSDEHQLKAPLSKSSYRIFIEYTDTYRLLLENSDDWSPPILSGHFFSKADKDPKAVIGKEMIEYVKEKSGKKYISFQGEDFEVTGVMGASFASSADYLVLLYKPDQFPTLPPDTRIVIDSDHKSTVTDITNKISENPSVTLIESAQKGLSRTANIPFIYYLLIFEFYSLLFLSIIVFLRYWYEKEKKMIYVLFLLGISKSKVNRQLFLKVFLNTTLSGIIAILLFLSFDSESLNILNQMVWLIILFFSSALALLGLFLRLDDVYSKRGVVRK